MSRAPDISVEDFVAALQGADGKYGRLLGLDLGTKTIGMAVSDSNWSIASPVSTIRRTKFTPDVNEMLSYADKENIRGLVMGLPLNMDGSEGPRAQSTRAFVRNLRGFTDLPVFFWDERLSSYAAEDAMLEANMTRRKRTEKIDQFAASIILQGCLDQLRAARAKTTG